MVPEEWVLAGSTSVPLRDESGVPCPVLSSSVQEKQGATGKGQWRPLRGLSFKETVGAGPV